MIRDIQEALARLVSVFRRRSLDRDFDDEFAGHIDLLTEQNERRGLSRDEARRRAIVQMGGLNATRNLHREARGLPRFERFLEALHALGRDQVHAARSLAKTRAFTFVCVASLGLGMGAAIAIMLLARSFTMPIPGVNTDGLVELVVTPQGPLRARAGDWAIENWSYPDFAELRDAAPGLTVSGWAMSESTVRMPDGLGAVRVPAMFVSADYFRTVGVSLARGPGFDPAADDAGNPRSVQPVVIVGYDFWRNRLNSAPDIVGSTLTLNAVQHVVVGIAPDRFAGHFSQEIVPPAQLWVPLGQHPRLQGAPRLRFDRDVDWVRILARLSPGVAIAQANASVAAIMSGFAERYPSSNEFKAASVEPYFVMGARMRYEVRLLQAVFLGMAAAALLLVCLNVSGMMLVRSALRERELSIREAIGASRMGLMRYLLSEAIMLAGLGGALGALVLFGVPAVLAWWFGRPVDDLLKPDAAVFAICAGLCLATSLAFGLLPAIRFSRPTLISSLKDNAGGGGQRVGRVHRLAAAVQVAVAVPILVISGVLLVQVRTVATADLGFEPAGLFAARLDLAAAGYTGERASFFLRSVRDSLEQASGVASVTVADRLPLDFGRRVRVSKEREAQARQRAASRDGTGLVNAYTARVAEGYLNTMDIPLLRGRSITAVDRAGGELVAVVSESLAVRLFPNGEAVGERIQFGFEGNSEQLFTIVGVSADFVSSEVRMRQVILLPLAQHPVSSVVLVARGAAGDQAAVLMPSALKNAVNDVDPDLVPTDIVTGQQLVQSQVEDYLTQSAIAGFIGGVALTLGALGVCGVIGLMVATRTREIAVRIALGASSRRVLGMVLSDVLKLVMPGVAGGVIVAAAVRRVLSTFQLGAGEPLLYVLVAAIVLLVALLAGLPAARRAAAVEPMVAMRSE